MTFLTLIALIGVMISKDWLLTLIVFVIAPPLRSAFATSRGD